MVRFYLILSFFKPLNFRLSTQPLHIIDMVHVVINGKKHSLAYRHAVH
jgi:hypothetical protein